MCGRFVIAFTDGFHARFHVPEDEGEVKPRYNIAPAQLAPVIFKHSPEHLEMMRWGLIPSWSKEEKGGLKLINARSETMSEKPLFRKLMGKQRCLVPTTGFYEWMKTDAGKIPYYIHHRERRFLAYAGLYDRWRSEDGSVISSFTILTTAANELMRPIHDRMPVILREEDEREWLDKKVISNQRLAAMFSPYPSEELEAYEVPKIVWNPAVESPDLIRPVAPRAKTVQMHF